MIFFDKDAVTRLLDMKSCIGLMAKALGDRSAGLAWETPRETVPVAPGKILGIMPAVNGFDMTAGVKIVTVFPENFRKGLPSHQGAVLLFETETGALEAVLDGEAITGIRTAAVSAAATDALARKDAHVFAVLGSGLQARRHLEAIRLVRDITEVRVWDIAKASSARYAAEMSERYCIPVRDCATSTEAVRGADVICTVTAAKEPILFGRDIKPGAHINAVGACAPDHRELDTFAVTRSLFFCDSLEAVKREAGDFLIPEAEGAVTQAHIRCELGRVLSGKDRGRERAEDITVFEALGLAVEDIAAANHIYKKAAGGA